MAKAQKGAAPQRRLLRSGHSVQFAQETDEGYQEEDDGIVESGTETEDEGGTHPSSDTAGAALMAVMQSLQKATNKKSTARVAAFHNRKTKTFTAARTKSLEVSQVIKGAIDDARAQIEQLKAAEVSFDTQLNAFNATWPQNEAAIESIKEIYPRLFDDLFPRRSKDLNSASEMLEQRPLQLEGSLRTVLKHANTHLTNSQEKEKLATDAQSLIRHYRALVLL
ncbi:hypothetical protein HGRIS_012766 [Hohenbuehelia grisea]|uniref:Uncharacterized protein n=1 Tax=Hohenbuehelia grisea TaxID=104357 RepID=A0ABR3ITD1_9AGAR